MEFSADGPKSPGIPLVTSEYCECVSIEQANKTGVLTIRGWAEFIVAASARRFRFVVD